ncbi:hypothetical protein ACS0TY_031820 [Phlomoides rotata]
MTASSHKKWRRRSSHNCLRACATDLSETHYFLFPLPILRSCATHFEPPSFHMPPKPCGNERQRSLGGVGVVAASLKEQKEQKKGSFIANAILASFLQKERIDMELVLFSTL